MGIGKFSTIYNSCLIGEVYTMTFEKEAPQYTTNLHTFYQVSRIDGYTLNSNIVYFYFSFKQGHSLHMHIETGQCE